MPDLQPLIDRAAAAANVFEEADAMQNAVFVLAPDQHGLAEICKGARMGRLPRACLLGVVAFLVPEGWVIDHMGHDACGLEGKLEVIGCTAELTDGARTVQGQQRTEALALLSAICRAIQAQEAQHVG